MVLKIITLSFMATFCLCYFEKRKARDNTHQLRKGKVGFHLHKKQQTVVYNECK